MNGNRIKRVMDLGLSSLQMTEREMNGLIRKAEGGKKVKKKLSVAMVLTIIIITMAATAIAATLVWEKYVMDVKKREQSQGAYASWEIKNKQDLVKSLVDMGYIEESDETRQLFNDTTGKDEQEKIADKLMMLLTKQTDAKEINADIITYSIFGPESTWTSEQRVWWQQVTNMFRNAEDDTDSFVPAGKDDLPETQAVAIAKAAIIKAYELPADALEQAQAVADMYVTKARPDYRRWMIQFQMIKPGTENYVESVYAAVVDNKGTVIADPDVSMPHVEETAAAYKSPKETTSSQLADEYYAMAEKAGNPNLQGWSLEEKAEFSNKMRDRILTALEQGRLQDLKRGESPVMVMIAAAHYVYGIPDALAISADDALKAARKAIRESGGYSEQEAESFHQSGMFYDVTDSEKPVWRFVFQPQKRFDMVIYRVEIDAKTGSIISCETTKSKPVDLKIEELSYYLKLF